MVPSVSSLARSLSVTTRSLSVRHCSLCPQQPSLSLCPSSVALALTVALTLAVTLTLALTLASSVDMNSHYARQWAYFCSSLSPICHSLVPRPASPCPPVASTTPRVHERIRCFGSAFAPAPPPCSGSALAPAPPPCSGAHEPHGVTIFARQTDCVAAGESAGAIGMIAGWVSACLTPWNLSRYQGSSAQSYVGGGNLSRPLES